MHRRTFIAGAAALGMPALLGPSATVAGNGCSFHGGTSVVCSHGFPEPPKIAAQPCRALCWATALAYVLRGFGAEIGTADVLDRYRLTPACARHNDRFQLLRAAGQWRDAKGRNFLVKPTEMASLHQRYPQGDVVAGVLDRIGLQPVLCGAAGHATVVTEVQVTHSAMARLRRDRVRVADPFGPNERCRDLTPAELDAPFYMIALSIRAL